MDGNAYEMAPRGSRGITAGDVVAMAGEVKEVNPERLNDRPL